LIGGLLGVMMVFYFVGLSVSAVGRTAQHVVEEVRRQFREHPEIMEYKVCTTTILTRARARA
ncbi:hypothetical protein EON62_00175, partial [archaeon]